MSEFFFGCLIGIVLTNLAVILFISLCRISAASSSDDELDRIEQASRPKIIHP